MRWRRFLGMWWASGFPRAATQRGVCAYDRGQHGLMSWGSAPCSGLLGGPWNGEWTTISAGSRNNPEGGVGWWKRPAIYELAWSWKINEALWEGKRGPVGSSCVLLSFSCLLLQGDHLRVLSRLREDFGREGLSCWYDSASHCRSRTRDERKATVHPVSTSCDFAMCVCVCGCSAASGEHLQHSGRGRGHHHPDVLRASQP